MNNRWLILASGCLIQTILGGIYAWSTFVPHLAKNYALSYAQCGLIFGMTFLTFTSAMIVAGQVLSRKGPRFTAIIASILFASGYLLASMSEGSFLLLLLSLGCITGCGIGFGYVCPLSTGMKWFPDNKGLVTGVAVAGFGAGAIVLSWIADFFLVRGTDILVFFRWFSLGSGLLLLTSALLLCDPPDPPFASSKAGNRSAFFTWPFILCATGMFSGTFAGLLIVGNLTPMILKTGLEKSQAVFAVSLFAIGNGGGRILWGKLFDLLNYKCIPWSLGSLAVPTAMLLFPLPARFLLPTVILAGISFGANFVIYAATITRFFGTGLFPHLYPVCFMAYGIAGLIGPGLGGALADKTGSYHSAIAICITLLSFAGALFWLKGGAFHHPLTTSKGVR